MKFDMDAFLIIVALLAVLLERASVVHRINRQRHVLEEELKKCRFSLEMSEQSVTILENELQRRIQEDGQSNTAELEKDSHKNIETEQSNSSDMDGESAFQFVENFLAERGAIAVDNSQINQWLELEMNYKSVCKELENTKTHFSNQAERVTRSMNSPDPEINNRDHAI